MVNQNLRPVESQKQTQAQGEAKPRPYETTDIKFAAFLRAIGVNLHSYSQYGRTKKKLKFFFAITRAEAEEHWRHFTNSTEEARIPAKKILSEYEDLRALRFS